MRAPGVPAVVVCELVAEGKGDDLVENLVAAGYAAQVNPVLRGDDASTVNMALPPCCERRRGTTVFMYAS